MKRSGKIVLALVSAAMCAGLLGGCAVIDSLGSGESKAPNLNADRGTDYKYDFINYMDIHLYGYNGAGFLEVQPKDFSVKDFSAEADYIAVKKAIDSMNLYLIPGAPDTTSYLNVDKAEGLSNGDIVTFSLKDSYKGDVSDVSLNTEPFQLQITGLGDPTEINLFDETSVEFYGLSGTDEVYANILNNGNLPKEFTDHAQYTVTPDSTPLEADKTILDISVTMDKDWLDENDYHTVDVYLGKNKYKADITGEKVLMTVLDPIDFGTDNTQKIGEAMFNAIRDTDGGKGIQQLGSVQQLDSSSGSYDPYTYTVVFQTDSISAPYQKCNIRIVNLHGDYKILSISDPSSTDPESMTEPLTGMQVLTSYYVEPTPDPSASADAENAAATAEPTAEPTAAAEETAAAETTENH